MLPQLGLVTSLGYLRLMMQSLIDSSAPNLT
jgi:hypothetical protein